MIHYVLATANSFPTCCSFCGLYEPIISDNVGNSPFMRIHQKIIIPSAAMYWFLNRTGGYGVKNILLLALVAFLSGREDGATSHTPEYLLTSCLVWWRRMEHSIEHPPPPPAIGDSQEPGSADSRAALLLSSSLGCHTRRVYFSVWKSVCISCDLSHLSIYEICPIAVCMAHTRRYCCVSENITDAEP